MAATKPEIAVQGLARMARRATTGAVPGPEHLGGRERLLATVARPAPPPARIGARLLVLATALALLLVAVLLVRRPEARLSFTVDGAPPGQAYVHAGPAGASARFSDGTRIVFAPGARGRVAEVDPHGARVSLEAGGSARFEVVHREGATWIAEAGPFTVTITGTSFELRWSGVELEVAMHAGSVVVRGPPAPEGVVVRAGQRLLADAGRAEVSRIVDLEDGGSSGSAGSGAADPTATVSNRAPSAPGSPTQAIR
jgi:ferric-dicitrate binding protein FerR (iron transport regulator)